MATLVILPGLDGTEVYIQPLLGSLPKSVRPLVISFPQEKRAGYAELLAMVRGKVSHLPEFYVLGWSFSGPLALMLASSEVARVKGIVLCATFVRSPHYLLSMLGFALAGPSIWTWRVARRMPLWIFQSANDPLRRAKSQTWKRVSAQVMAARLRAIRRVDVSQLLREIRQPLLYIGSSRDTFVPKRNAKEIARLQPSVRVVTIEGPHLAMYFDPHPAAQAIAALIGEIEVRTTGE